jgi:hypothetical protein
MNPSIKSTLASLVSRLPALGATQGVASGISAVELSTAELDRISGGVRALVSSPTCSCCVEDDCGYDAEEFLCC